MLQPRLTPRQVGYCQGMAFIAAVFLSYMPEEVRGSSYQHATLLRRYAPQQDSFFALLSLMNFPPYHMEGLFSEGMIKVRSLCSQFEVCLAVSSSNRYSTVHGGSPQDMLKHFLPRLSAHFAKLHVDANLYAAQVRGNSAE